jgi:hypothetical protein
VIAPDPLAERVAAWYMMNMKVKVDFNNCRPSESCPEGEEARCVCGGLVARLVAEGVELKCRRCRRILVVPLLTDAEAVAADEVGERSGRLRGRSAAVARAGSRP